MASHDHERTNEGAMRHDTRWKRTQTVYVLVALAVLAATGPASAQDSNILDPPDTVEKRLIHDHFEIVDRRGSRFEGDRTSRVALEFDDGQMMVAKWAPAPRGGEAFNNNPRYEVASYEIQKLFLEPHEYVVPPTVLRAFPLSWYRELDPDARATLRSTESVLVALQYWLFNIAGDDFWDRDRFATDTAYAHHLANFNILTYLIRHNDQNQGNYLISGNTDNPRIFSVDNGLAFESERSDQGARWRRLRVDRLPEKTVERLRDLTEPELYRRLETVAQFRVEPDGTLTPVPPEAAVEPDRGVRRTDDMIQFGLTRWEIQGVWRRVEHLLGEVEDGHIEVF